MFIIWWQLFSLISGLHAYWFILLTPRIFSPKAVFTFWLSPSLWLTAGKSLCLCYPLHSLVHFTAASSMDVSKVHRHWVCVSRIRNGAIISSISWQLWDSLESGEVQSFAQKRLCKPTCFFGNWGKSVFGFLISMLWDCLVYQKESVVITSALFFFFREIWFTLKILCFTTYFT